MRVLQRTKFLRRNIVSPIPQDAGPPLSGCPPLIIQDLPSYCPYPDAISSMRNPTTRLAIGRTKNDKYLRAECSESIWS